MLFLSDHDVERMLDMKDVIEAVEEGFKLLAMGKVKAPLRSRVSSERYNGDILSMPCLIEDFKIYTNKIVSVYPENVGRGIPTIHAVIIVADAVKGVPVALIEARYLTALRTGAASAVATKYLSRKDSKVLAVIGCGYQARTQTIGVCEVRNIQKIVAYDVIVEKAVKYGEEIREKIGVEIEVTDSAKKAIEEADIIVTATTSREPVVKREWIKPGTHINAIGAYTPEMRELDTETIIDSKVVVDNMEAALSEAGDIIIPIKEGRYSKDKIHGELGEILLGVKPGRTTSEEITIFKSVGLAVQDNAATYALLKKYARELQV
ncbi:MAG: ornithine cyclodeaminase family protein [Nitrososphaerota archaeon]